MQIAQKEININTAYAFGVGSLSRESLEDLAADLAVEFNKHLPDDELRSSVLESLRAQGEPCIKVEYDCSYTGGDYSGVGTSVYLPLSLIAAYEGLGDTFEDAVDSAFRKQTHFDSMHIVHYESDQLFASSGAEFVGSKFLDTNSPSVTPVAGNVGADRAGIIEALSALAKETEALRSNNEDEVVGQGPTPFTIAVARLHVKTVALQRQLASIIRNENLGRQCA